MKYNKMVNESDIKNKNTFLISCVCSILLLLTLCYFGVNGSVKGTAAAGSCSGYNKFTCQGTAGCTWTPKETFRSCTGTYAGEETTVTKSCSGLSMSDCYSHTGCTYNTMNQSCSGSYQETEKSSLSCSTLGESACKSKSGCTANYSDAGSCSGTPTGTGTGTGTEEVDLDSVKCNAEPNCSWQSTKCVCISDGGDDTTGEEDEPTCIFSTKGAAQRSGEADCLYGIDTLKEDESGCWDYTCKTSADDGSGSEGTCIYKSDEDCESATGKQCDYDSSSGCYIPQSSGSQQAQCWFCGGTWTWQVGQGSCQYPDASIIKPGDCKAKNNADDEKTSCDNSGNGKYSSPENAKNANTCSAKQTVSVTETNGCYSYSCFTNDPDDDTPPTGNPDGNPTTKTYKATFNPNGGTLNGSSSKTCNTTGTSCSISSLPTASKDGYTFKGWGKTSSCTSGSTDKLTLSSHTTFYACYTNNSGSDSGNGNNNTNVDENPTTGEITIALVWFAGLFAIAYSVYYFKHVREN